MARISLILALVLCSSTLAYAQGRSFGTAAVMTINSTVSGSISDQWYDHYWKITLVTDGYLRVQMNCTASIGLTNNIYDVDSTYGISMNGPGTSVEVFAFLKPGTYSSDSCACREPREPTR